MIALLIDSIQSDIGEIIIVTEGEALCTLDFADCEDRMLKLLHKRYPSFELINHPNPQGYRDRVQAYLSGQLDSLDDIPVTTGGTPFQQEVWSALRTIPVGTILSYQELAIQINRERACRAVGSANSLNPIALVLPCHRVVGANLSLTGYAGGIDRKRWLLKHEGVNLAATSQTDSLSDSFSQLNLLP